mgnify:FL=1
MNEWKIYKLSEIGTIIGGATPSTSNPHYYGGQIPWITPKDLSTLNGRFIEKGERNITEKGLSSCSAQLLPQGSILFTSRAPIGYVAIAKNPITTNQGFKSIVPNEKVNNIFLYYLMVYNKSNIEAMGSGTTFKEVSGSTMKKVEIRIPNIDVQKRIASILASLDDKIELNRRINDNLEEQAKALFNHYFIQNTENLGEWQDGVLTDIAQYLNGLAMQKYPAMPNEAGLPVLKIKELGQGQCDTNSDRCSSLIKPEYIISDGTIIFSWSGTLLVDIWCGGKCGLNQHLFKVSSAKYPQWFVFYWTKHHLNKFIRIAKDKAVTMGHIKRCDLEISKVKIPSKQALVNLDKLFSPIFNRMVTCRIENRKLSSLRDTLLPKLMSGEISVEEVSLD